MAAVTRLVTLVDVRDDVADARQMSVSARHEAELADGRRVLLLDDRGWTSSAVRAYWVGELPDAGSRREHLDAWAVTSVEEIEETARVVVGPDEPFDGRSHEEMEADHWAYLADVLRQQGVVVDAQDLKRVPHDVLLSERLLARIDRGQGVG
jgi:dTDP-glucose pyrophosphorylase